MTDSDLKAVWIVLNKLTARMDKTEQDLNVIYPELSNEIKNLGEGLEVCFDTLDAMRASK